VKNRRRRVFLNEQGVQADDTGLGSGAEVTVQGNGLSPPGADVVDRPGRNRDSEHLLQAESLSTELDLVVIPSSPPSTFVLDRERDVVTAV
jgi:hypothetical protein